MWTSSQARKRPRVKSINFRTLFWVVKMTAAGQILYRRSPAELNVWERDRLWSNGWERTRLYALRVLKDFPDRRWTYP